MATLSRVSFTPDPETRASIVLDAIPGLGPRAFQTLLASHRTAAGVLEAARRNDLSRRVPARLRRLLVAAGREPSRFRRLDLPVGCNVIPWTSVEYPAGLRRLARPPLVLFAMGPLALDQPDTVTIVGTRAATEYGRRTAFRLAAELADAGWRVASGIASGIDSAAHRGALEAGGESVGVPGCGLDHVYPASNRSLYRELADRGLLLSEHLPSVRPSPGLFPRRNRVLAGLARAVVVVQAGTRSGALITAARAGEIGVEVLAVPGPVDLPASRGVNELLRDGAGVVTCASDVLSMLGEGPGAYAGSPRAAQPGSGGSTADLSLFDDKDEPIRSCGSERGAGTDEAGRLLGVLGVEPAHVDLLARRTGLAVPRTLSLLGRLSLEGRVQAVGGGRYRAVR